MLNIINPGTKTLRISCPTKRKEGITEYEQIKSKIKKTTIKYGSAISTYHIIGYTVYIMFAMLLTTFLGIYEYLWYYVICDSIIICIFITSVAK